MTFKKLDYENTHYSEEYGVIGKGHYATITFFMSIVAYLIVGAAFTAPIYLIYLIPKGIYSLIQNIKTKKQN